MFGGYTDIQVYLDESQSVGVNGSDMLIPIPPYYLPCYTLPDPWHHNATSRNDFILIAEFSEMEGPKPLITIPNGGHGDFDLNSFSLRILSTDQQAMQSGIFTISEDTQVLLSDNQQGINAFVHHFTLHDSQARGFVRPFCMAYVTPCPKKLTAFYAEMSSEFAKVARFFRYGNLMLFVKDMTHYLTDLQYTREKFIEKQESSDGQEEEPPNTSKKKVWKEEDVLRSLTVESLDNCIQEVKSIVEKSSSLLTDRRLEARFERLEERVQEERNGSVIPDVLCLSSSLTSTLTLSSSPNHFSNGRLNRCKRGSSFSDLEKPRHSVDIYKPKLVPVLNRRRFDKTLRTLHELCHWGAREGIARLRSIHRYLSRSLSTLEVERKDSTIIEPSASLLTIGRCVTVNFLNKIDLECAGSCWSLDTIDNPAGIQYTNSCLYKRWLSDDTLASYQSAESFLSCHDSIKDDAPTFIMGSAYVSEHEATSLASYDILSLNSRDELESNGFSTQNMSSSLDESACYSGLDEGYSSNVPRNESTKALWREFSQEESIESQKAKKVCIISMAQHLNRIHVSSTPGHGILALLAQFSFAHHIIYSLMCGRPVVVVAGCKMEKEVRAAVTALSLFIAGHPSQCQLVIPWHTRPLRIPDLSNIRLVGLCRQERMLSTSVTRYISVLDLEKKSFCGPAYQGTLLNGISQKRKSYKCEKAFVAYIHTPPHQSPDHIYGPGIDEVARRIGYTMPVMGKNVLTVLTEFANKAYIFYHAFCVRAPSPAAQQCTSQWHSPHLSQRMKEDADKFLEQLHLASHDANIVQYLTDVVKMQQVNENVDAKDCSLPPIHLTYTKCTLFK